MTKEWARADYFDIRNGVIPPLLGIDARALGRFDNPLGERGSNQRSHGRVSLIPQLGPTKGAFRPFTAWSDFLHYALYLGLRLAGNRGRPKRIGQNEQRNAKSIERTCASRDLRRLSFFFFFAGAAALFGRRAPPGRLA